MDGLTEQCGAEVWTDGRACTSVFPAHHHRIAVGKASALASGDLRCRWLVGPLTIFSRSLSFLIHMPLLMLIRA